MHRRVHGVTRLKYTVTKMFGAAPIVRNGVGLDQAASAHEAETRERDIARFHEFLDPQADRVIELDDFQVEIKRVLAECESVRAESLDVLIVMDAVSTRVARGKRV